MDSAYIRGISYNKKGRVSELHRFKCTNYAASSFIQKPNTQAIVLFNFCRTRRVVQRSYFQYHANQMRSMGGLVLVNIYFFAWRKLCRASLYFFNRWHWYPSLHCRVRLHETAILFSFSAMHFAIHQCIIFIKALSMNVKLFSYACWTGQHTFWLYQSIIIFSALPPSVLHMMHIAHVIGVMWYQISQCDHWSEYLNQKYDTLVSLSVMCSSFLDSRS